MSGTGITGVRPPALGGEALGAALAEEAATPRMASAPVYVQAADPMAPAFGGAALGAAIFVFFGIFALISSVMGNHPDAVAWFGPHKQNINLFLIAVIGLVVVAVGFVIGMVTGKVAAVGDQAFHRLINEYKTRGTRLAVPLFLAINCGGRTLRS